MTVERTFRCDGPGENEGDHCPRHVKTFQTHPPDHVFLTVTQPGSELHFCGWDCLLRYAATIPPSEVVGLDGSP